MYMDIDILKEISTFGVGAVIAGIVLHWKRHDDMMYQNTLKSHLEESQKRELQLINLVQLQVETLQALKQTITQLDLFIKMQKKLNE